MGLQSPRLGLAIDELASLHFLDGNIHLAPITIDDFSSRLDATRGTRNS